MAKIEKQIDPWMRMSEIDRPGRQSSSKGRSKKTGKSLKVTSHSHTPMSSQQPQMPVLHGRGGWYAGPVGCWLMTTVVLLVDDICGCVTTGGWYPHWGVV